MPSKLSEAEIRASLTTAGYTQVHDVKYDDGLWEARAHSATGERVEVYADRVDGSVVSAERD
ncbi:PepSY domain-containing protein [Xanthomonas sp. SS]|uniref:PepSY domain-containing protein n=1 Tax=Xanthomonas sp. SS TaxID=2724122 RepID=UPI00163A663F|nr:PepSY domain-containing protein [Xanthomonas sp. SS]